MKKMMVFILFISFGSAICQDDLNDNLSEEKEVISEREYFSSITVGAIEFFSFSIGYQINQSFSLSLKAQNIVTAIGLGIVTGLGVGLSGSYYYEDELLNSIKLSVIPLYSLSDKTHTDEFVKVVSIECTFNNEKLIAHSFRFYYELGGAICIWKDRDAFIAPSIKCGLLYNF
jgi:hypothetical protein